MGKRRKSDHEKRFLLAVAKAARAKQQLPSHPVEATRIAIEKAGGVAKWIKQDAMRLGRFKTCMRTLISANSGQKIKVQVKKRTQWPDSLKPIVKGYHRPKNQKGGATISPPPLSAGTPGNEETDPGHRRS